MTTIGRVSKTPGSQLSKLIAATSIVETRYPLTEESFREFGVKEKLLPKHLGNINLYSFNQSTVYNEKPLKFSIKESCKVSLFENEYLSKILPEGLSGELTKDVTMLPPNQPLGIVSRKSTVDLISQLAQYQQNIAISASGFLLDGKRGSGKSSILNHIVMWARENGWLVIFEPDLSRYSRDIGPITRSNANIFIQTDFAANLLSRIRESNGDLLKNIPIDLKIYGSTSLDGSNVKYARKAFEPLIKQIIDQELENYKGDVEIERLKLWNKYRNDFKLPSLRTHLEPKTLFDIVEFGAGNPPLANQALYELFEQLKHQTKYPLLIAVDNWNECFPVSEYLSSKYQGTKYNGWIPGYNLSIPRLFCHWDGHQYRRGIKILATSWNRIKRRNFNHKLLGIRTNEMRTIRNFTPLEFNNYVANMYYNGTLHDFPNDKLPYYYMMTDGNGFEARRLLTLLY